MSWTAANPVSIGDVTKKKHFDRLWDNLDLIYTFLASCNLTDHGLLAGSGTGAVTPLAAATNGQIPIGKSGGYDPVIAAITQGNGLTITPASGSITVAHAAHTGDVTGTTELTIGASKVTEGKIAALNVTEGKFGDAAVTQSKLKTNTETESIHGTSVSGLGQQYFDSSGEYGFYPRVKVDENNSSFDIGDPYPGQDYKTLVSFDRPSHNYTYITMQYVY